MKSKFAKDQYDQCGAQQKTEMNRKTAKRKSKGKSRRAASEFGSKSSSVAGNGRDNVPASVSASLICRPTSHTHVRSTTPMRITTLSPAHNLSQLADTYSTRS